MQIQVAGRRGKWAETGANRVPSRSLGRKGAGSGPHLRKEAGAGPPGLREEAGAGPLGRGWGSWTPCGGGGPAWLVWSNSTWKGMGILTHSSPHIENLAEDAALRGVGSTDTDVGEALGEVHSIVDHRDGENNPDASDSPECQEDGQKGQVAPHAGPVWKQKSRGSLWACR